MSSFNKSINVKKAEMKDDGYLDELQSILAKGDSRSKEEVYISIHILDLHKNRHKFHATSER